MILVGISSSKPSISGIRINRSWILRGLLMGLIVILALVGLLFSQAHTLGKSAMLLKRDYDFHQRFYGDTLARSYYSSTMEKAGQRFQQANFWVENAQQLEEAYEPLLEIYLSAYSHPESDRLRRSRDDAEIFILFRVRDDYDMAKRNYERSHFFVKWIPGVPSADDVVRNALRYFNELRREPR